jgi:molybdenum cofactor synthesis domain-containing protein
MASRDGAAIVAVGNELLSGKVADTNTPLVIAELRALGMPVLETRTIPDDVEWIARTFRELSEGFEVVFSSGGVGPTHDDVTVPGIAAAFNLPLARNAELARAIEAFYGAATNEAVLRMADIPEGAVLLHEPSLVIPVVLVRNIYVLPGEPTIFRRKFFAIRERFRRAPFFLRKVFTNQDEGEIASALAETEKRFAVVIGSYPRYDRADYKVMVTIESKEPERVERALAALLERLDPAAVVRKE